MDNRPALRALEIWCSDHALEIPDQALTQFSAYIDLLLHYQKQTNLTGFSTPEALVRELFIDSLQIMRVGSCGNHLIDVGTGAGFPAIPIKIMRPESHMILVEPRVKRYAFLRLVERELGLKNVQIFKSRIENVVVPDDLNMAISKAFAPLPEWLDIARPWAEKGAEIACLVSKNDWDAFDLASHGYVQKRILIENDRVYAVVGLHSI